MIEMGKVGELRNRDVLGAGRHENDAQIGMSVMVRVRILRAGLLMRMWPLIYTGWSCHVLLILAMGVDVTRASM